MKCNHCGKELSSNAESKRPFCNDDCLNAYLKEYVTRKGVCETCGKPLLGRQRKYCNECAFNLRMHRDEIRERHKKPKAEVKKEPKKKGRPKKPRTFAEICKFAREKGLSYGECVARYKL